MKMKQRIALLSAKLIGWLCRRLTVLFSLSCSGSVWNGESEWIYLSDWGPKMLIFQDGRVRYLMSAFATKVRYDSPDQTGKVTGCKPLLITLEPRDKVIFGYERVYRKYRELQ